MAGIKVTKNKNLQRNTLRGQILKHALISIMLFRSMEAGTTYSVVSQFRDTELLQITSSSTKLASDITTKLRYYILVMF